MQHNRQQGMGGGGKVLSQNCYRQLWVAAVRGAAVTVILVTDAPDASREKKNVVQDGSMVPQEQGTAKAMYDLKNHLSGLAKEITGWTRNPINRQQADF